MESRYGWRVKRRRSVQGGVKIRLLPLCLLVACSGADVDDDFDPGARDAGPARDGGARDAGPPRDAGPLPPDHDAGVRDGGEEISTGTWSEGPSLLAPLQETAVVALRGEVYVLGGYGTNGFGTRVEAYDPSTDQWRSVADFPANFHHANAAVVDDKIYVVGFLVAGFQDDGRVFVYDPDTDGWTEQTAMAPQRARGSSVVGVHDGEIYVVGGLKNAVPTADFDVYDPKTQTWRPLAPIPRAMDHGAGGVHDGKLYVAGGRAGGISSHVPRLDIYDIATATWSTGPAMPTGRAGTAGAFYEGRLFVFGGEGNGANPPTNLFVEVEAFDVARGAWDVLAPMDPAIHGTGAAVVDDRIYLPGGATVQAFGAVDRLSVFDP